MPNHIHILLEIDRSIVRTGRDLSARDEIDGSPVRTGRNLSLLDEPQKIKSISSLIGSYKTTTSKLIHLAGNYQFEWHRSFHDHIVETQSDFDRIFEYINNNPMNWKKDTFNGKFDAKKIEKK